MKNWKRFSNKENKKVFTFVGILVEGGRHFGDFGFRIARNTLAAVSRCTFTAVGRLVITVALLSCSQTVGS